MYQPPGSFPPPPPPRKMSGRKRGLLFASIFAVLCAAVGLVLSTAGTISEHRNHAALEKRVHALQHEHFATAQPVDTAPAVTAVRYIKRVLFVVKGNAPGGADITYGSDSDNRTAPGTLGALGTGAAVPWHATVPYKSDALYYVVDAQLEGSGDITCTTYAQVTAVFSDGTRHTAKKKIASGHASGGYSICTAES